MSVGFTPTPSCVRRQHQHRPRRSVRMGEMDSLPIDHDLQLAIDEGDAITITVTTLSIGKLRWRHVAGRLGAVDRQAAPIGA